ncbi:hypothetical protein C0J52_26185 [Blattella germanica]|nr:hypothetical protein C0J52_26185 [Blattella germanica]
MGVDIQTYRVRIGPGVKKILSNASQTEVGAISEEFFYGIVVAILLIVSCIESHPGPNTMEENIKSISEILADLKKGQDRMSSEMTKMSAAMDRRITSVENIVKDVKVELENTMEKCRRLDRSNARWEHESRLNNIIIFGIREEFHERNWDTCMIVLDILNSHLSINLSEFHINNTYRLGRGRNRPILVKFCSFITKDYVLGRTTRLRNSNIRIDQDYYFNTRNIRKQLLPFLKKARSESQRASLVKDKIRINGKIYDLEHCTKLFENPCTEERNNRNSLSPRQDTRSFRSTSADGRKNTEENGRVSITQRRSSSKSPIREHQPPWSLQTSPRYNAACAALQTESQTENNENTGKEPNYRKTRQHKDKNNKVDHRYDLRGFWPSINNKTFSNMNKGSGY